MYVFLAKHPLSDKHLLPDKLPSLDSTRRACQVRRVIIFITVIRQYAPLVQELLDKLPFLDRTRRACQVRRAIIFITVTRQYALLLQELLDKLLS